MRDKVFILISMGFLFSYQSWAQYNSDNNKFTVDEKKGCAPLIVQVTYPANGPKPACGTSGISCTAVMTKSDGSKRTKNFTSGDTLKFSQDASFQLKIVYSTTTVDNDSMQIQVTQNIAPTFEAYSCNGNQVKVDVKDSNYAYYIINYNDGFETAPLPAVAATDIHTYAAPPPSPSTRNVSVRGFNGPNTKDNCMSSSLPVTAATVLPSAAITQVEVLTGTDVKVDFATNVSVQYRFMIGTNNATSFQQYKTIYSPTLTAQTETIPGIRPDDNFYCFRIDTFNPCGNNVVANSPVICSSNFDAVAQDNQNNLTWTTAANTVTHTVTDFSVVKNVAPIVPTILPPQSTFIDTDVICNSVYEYQLVANYPGNVKSLSLKKNVTAFSNNIPPAISDISSVVENEGVLLTWPTVTVPLKEYTITKSINGNYDPLTTTTDATYTDATYATDAVTCYKISYTDQCNNQSPVSLEACPIQLIGTLQQDNATTLTWSAYNGWTNGVMNYIVEKYNEQGNLLESFDVGSNLLLLDNADDFINQVFLYRVFAYANDGTVEPSASNIITVIKQPNLFYPTAFTPNGDGVNDNFKVFGQFLAQFEMKIFNRWGEMLYATDDLGGIGWDGGFKGSIMPEATYVFTAKITDLAGRSFDRSGSVLLLRKK